MRFQNRKSVRCPWARRQRVGSLVTIISVLRDREMSVATSRIQETLAVPAETLYQFDETPLLARQRQQESNARSYPRRIPLALKRARGGHRFHVPRNRL